MVVVVWWRPCRVADRRFSAAAIWCSTCGWQAAIVLLNCFRGGGGVVASLPVADRGFSTAAIWCSTCGWQAAIVLLFCFRGGGGVVAALSGSRQKVLWGSDLVQHLQMAGSNRSAFLFQRWRWCGGSPLAADRQEALCGSDLVVAAPGQLKDMNLLDG
eukprot:313930-Pelagomonas_calceolata.AAC.4